MKKLLFSLTALFMLFVVAACDDEDDNDNKNKEKEYLLYNLATDSETWDPNYNSATDGGHIIANMFEGIYRATPDGIELAGATDVQVTNSGKTYTITLRDDAKWSNGESVTADDYAFAWFRVIDPTNPSEYSFIMSPYIVGASDYINGDATKSEVGITVVDDYTLKVELNNPVPYFKQLLSFYTYLPVYSGNDNYNDGWEKEAETAISNGPFKFIEYKIGQHVLLEKNEHYYNKDDVKLDGIKFLIIDDANTALNAYKQDQVHVLDSVPLDEISTLLSTDSDFKIEAEMGTYYYIFNMDDDLIGTPAGENGRKVRQALSMAIDRTSLVENIAKGGQVPATTFVPTTVLNENGQPWDTGLDYGISKTAKATEAQALLAEAGYDTQAKLDELASHIKLGFNQTASDGHKKIAEAIQEMWKQNLGLEITLEQQEWAVFQESRRLGEYELARGGWLGDYPDANSMLDLFTSYSGNNDAQWRYVNGDAFSHDTVLNPGQEAFDQAIADAMTLSGQAREDKLKEAEKILLEDEVALLPIYHYNRTSYVNSDLVTGVERTQMGAWWFGDAELK